MQINARPILDKLLSTANKKGYAEYELPDGGRLGVRVRYEFSLKYTPMMGKADVKGFDLDGAFRIIATSEEPARHANVIEQLRNPMPEVIPPHAGQSAAGAEAARAYDPGVGPHGERY